MKQFLKVLAVLCCMAMLLALSACGEEPAAPTTEPTTEPTTQPTTIPTEPAPTQEELAAIYTDAVAALGTEAVGMDVTISQTMTVGTQTFTEEAEQSISYWNLGGEDYLAKISDTTSYGNYESSVEEIYGGGNVYQTLNDLQYTAPMTAEDFSSRYAPVQLLDTALYTLTVDEAETTVTFSDATAGEAWLVNEDAVLNSASGTAVIGEDGKLASTTYTIDYTYGSANYVTSYTVTYTDAGRQPTIPEDTTEYTALEAIDAMWLLEHAYGYLNQAKQVSTTILETLQSEAAGFVMNQQYNINSYVHESGIDFRVESSVFGMDPSGSTSSENDEKFVDGKYSSSLNGGREEYDSSITQADLETYLADKLIENILEADTFTGATITDVGGVYLIEYAFIEEMGEAMCQTISYTLFGGDVLGESASKYVTNTMEYYLALDKYSKLPTAVGIKYEGCHTIQGRKYLLIQQADQSFDLASLSAYEAIHEETSPDVEPENKPTPLFYHVTGTDGQEMWLFGTIHVGDDRTGYLPKEITDALLASDALALECDTESFYDSLEDDEELSKQVSEAYYYSDGTIADHLDTEDLYESAVQLMKATGNYSYNAEHMKPDLWSGSIDNFYLRQGYKLTSDKGVESRLEKIAEDNDIPLREVESTLFQIQMTAGFSEYLQEFMLFSSVVSGDFAWEGSEELYELWCSGDEAALIEEMVNEPWVITEEDLADPEELDEEELQRRQEILDNLDSINAELAKLQEEYVTAMESSRNAGMLEVAKEYLESDDVVFYAVGLAHLLAEDGLVNTLREAGYTVELVTYAE